MVSLRSVEDQLREIGCNFQFWGRSEIRELSSVLMPDEAIAQCVNGSYENGFALLCVTQCRVLLVDRKPMLLTIEDIRYDMIAEVDFHNRLLNSTVRIFTPMHNLAFSSWSHIRLRKCVDYIQQRVMEIRQQSPVSQQFQTGYSRPAALNGANPAMNPYTKVPLLSRRRRFPSIY
ncbi:MAG: PH domain-containing protein [Candidatus Saccharimonadales bacterium]